jgi:hypothetical protein
LSNHHRYADRPGHRERAMECDPEPTRGEPGEFRQDASRQARSLFEMRAFKARVVAEREGASR